jgi:DNA topoisomerase-2
VVLLLPSWTSLHFYLVF